MGLVRTDEEIRANAEIGRRLKELRRRLEMSQAELGAMLGVSFQQIQKYERGSNRISAARLGSVCQALYVPVGQFYPHLAENLVYEADHDLLLEAYRMADPSLQRHMENFARIITGRPVIELH